jgi:hypothetical protein
MSWIYSQSTGRLSHPGTASQGCIIPPRGIRERIRSSGNTTLEVLK